MVLFLIGCRLYFVCERPSYATAAVVATRFCTSQSNIDDLYSFRITSPPSLTTLMACPSGACGTPTNHTARASPPSYSEWWVPITVRKPATTLCESHHVAPKNMSSFLHCNQCYVQILSNYN